MQKGELRKKVSDERSSFSSSQVQNYSRIIIKKLINYINWGEIKTINAYQTIKSKNEVDISILLDFLNNNYPDVQIDMTESKISESQNIPEGQTYDLVIVPLIAFDRQGNRLGYGGGYYDKFLAKNNYKQAIGLAYSLQEIKKLPVEEHDQSLDLIITEKEIIRP